MSEFREELLTRMIHIYGFEHPIVVSFAQMCESYPANEPGTYWDKCLETVVDCHEKNPYMEVIEQ